MIPSAPEATIYLADVRGCSQNEWFRSYHTLNFGNYQVESRKSLENLVAVNDDTLKEECSIVHSLTEDTSVILIPLVGEVKYNSSASVEGKVDVGQAQHLYMPANSRLEITNPYNSELINFLQLWFNFKDKLHVDSRNYLTEFDLIHNSNKQIGLQIFVAEGMETQVSIGKYKGRKGGTYGLKDEQKGVFVFVIDGIFEVQDRLIQSRDSLLIRNPSEIEYEALSNDAIILIVDL